MKYVSIIASLLCCFSALAQKNYVLNSPDGQLRVTVTEGAQLSWEITHDGTQVITPSVIGLNAIRDGKVVDFGKNVKVSNVKRKSVDETFPAPFYKKSHVTDRYNEMSLKCKDGFTLQVRAYDDAAAYRIVNNGKGDLTVLAETADFNFDKDYQTFVPYVNDNRGGERYCYSFESYYDEAPMSQMFTDSLAITPLMVCLDEGKKAVVMDAGVMDYPGMYLKVNPQTRQGLVSEFAPVPLETEIGGFDRLNLMPTSRAEHIAEITTGAALPWRAVVVTTDDSQLLGSDIAQLLAPACRIADTSWIKPGKVAWEWWNTCTLTGVDFKTGMNTPTYLKFIDFAAANGLEYIIIDEGWSGHESLLEDLNPDIDLEQIVAYGKDKNVGVILWAAWRNAAHDTDEAFSHYADMGVKGFKVDFIDRDDQIAVSSLERLAEAAARHHLLLDFHGMKPNGLQRAYPNIVNYEGVKGLENAKWEPITADGPLHDFPRYDVTAPYLRMLAGPMDYTPGAMTNKNRSEFRAVNDHPMSMGTRVHQMAMYTVFEAPLQMLADSPNAYMKNQECTDFIAQVPTTFDETMPLCGEIGEYIAVARRKGDTWYIGALTNWNERDIELDLSRLSSGEGPKGFIADIFDDGINADTEATDYIHTHQTLSTSTPLKIRLMPGGGWTARLTPTPNL